MTKVAVIFAMAIFALNMLIDNPYSHRLARAAINTKLTEASGLKLEFESIHLRLVPLSLDLYGVKLVAKDYPDEPLVSMARLYARVSSWSLILGKPRLATVETQELKSAWPPRPEIAHLLGLDRVDEGPTAWPPTMNLPVDRLQLKDSSLQWTAAPLAAGQAPMMRAVLRGLDIDLHYSDWQSADLNLLAHEVDVSYKDRPMLDKVQVRIQSQLRKNHVASQVLSVSGKDMDVTGHFNADLRLAHPQNGKFTRPFASDVLEAVDVESEFSAKLDLSPLGAVIDTEATDGPVSATGKFMGSFPVSSKEEGSWNLAIDAQSHGARIDGFQLYDSSSHLVFTDAQMLFQDAIIREKDVRYATGDGYIKFNDAMDMRFHIRPERFPLNRLLNALKVPDFTAVNADLVSQDVTLAGKGDPFNLRVEGDLRLDDFVIAAAPKSSPFALPQCQIHLLLQIDDVRVKVPPVDGACQARANVAAKKAAEAETPPQPTEESVAVPSPSPKSPVDQTKASVGHTLRLGGDFFYETRQGMDLSIALKDFPSETLRAFSRLDHRGPLSGRVTIKGPYDGIRVDAEVATPRLSLFGVVLKDMSAAALYDVKANRVEVPRFLATPEGGGDISGQKLSLDLNRDWLWQGEMHIHELPASFVAAFVASFSPNTHFGMHVVSLDANVALPLKRPLAGKGDISFALRDGSWDERSLFTDARGRLSNKGDGWQLPLAEILNHDVMVRLALDHRRRLGDRKAGGGKEGFNPLRVWGIDDDDQAHVHLEMGPSPEKADSSVYPNSFVDLPLVGSYFDVVDLTGVTRLNADLEGEVAHLQGQFNGAAERLYLFKSPLAPLQFSGTFRDGKLDVDRIQQAGNTLTGRLQIDLASTGLPYSLYLSLRQFDLRALGTETFFRDPRNFAYVNGEWELTGKLASWWHSQGYLKIHKILASYVIDADGKTQTLDLGLVEPVVMDIGPEGWNWRDHKTLRLAGSELDFSLTADHNVLPDDMHLAWSGNLKIGLLRRLFSAIETGKGEVEFSGSAVGSVVDPDVTMHVKDRKVTEGEANWEPLTLGFTGYSPAFTNIQFDALMEDGLFKIQSFKANKGTNGVLTMRGVFNPGDPLLENTRLAIDASQIELNRFAVPVLSYADATLNGNFVLSGRSAPFKLSGNLEVAKAQSFGAFDLRDQIINMVRRKRFSTSVAPAEPLITFDVQVNANETIKIRNRSLIATLSNDLLILGDNNAPVALGQVKINKGTFNYKRSFDIQRGNITFDEPVSPPDPKLDIAGETTVSQYRVTTLITGYSSNPVVTLSVDPPNRPDGTPITKIDIIYLLSSGSLPKVERGDTSGSAAARSEAFNLLIGQFEEPIEKLFDLSGQTVIRQVYLDTYPAEEDGRPVARLNLPINLSDDVNLILQVDDDSNTKISTEYSINDNVSVTGSFDKKREDKNTTYLDNTSLPADTGVDLRFRFSFP